MEIEKLICHHSAAKEHINFGYTILFPDYFHFFPTAFSFAGVRVVKRSYFVFSSFYLFVIPSCLLTICISRCRRIACFRPDVLPVGKNGTENAYPVHPQCDSEILTNQPACKNTGNTLRGHPVSRMQASVAKDISVCHEEH